MQKDLQQERRAELLAWVQRLLFILLAGAYAAVLVDHPPGSHLRNLYSWIILVLVISTAAGFLLNRSGRYLSAAALTLLFAAAAPWAAFIGDPHVLEGDLFPLVYVVLPVLISSVLLPLFITIALSVVQVSLLLAITAGTPAWNQQNSASLFLFICMVSALGITSNFLSRRSDRRIQSQQHQLEELADQLQQEQAHLERENLALREAERALHHSEGFLREIINAAPLAVITVDTEGSVLTWNAAAEQIFGWTEEEARGDIPPFIQKERRKEYFGFLHRVLQGESLKQEELIRKRKNGQIVYVSLSTARLIGENGTCTGVLSILSNITEQKLSREHIAQQKKNFQNLFQGSPNAIALLDREHRILQINPAFSTIFGYSPSEAEGSLLHDLIVPEHLREEAEELSAMILEHGSIRREDDRRTKEGTIVRVQIIGYPNIHKGETTGAFAVYQDLTEQRKLEHQLQQSQRIDSIGRLAGGIAHDFNNMLGVILGYTEMAMDRIDPSESLYGDLKEVHEAAQRSAELTKQLLTFARKQMVNPRLVKVNKAVLGLTGMLRRLIGEEILLEMQLASKDPSVFIDPSQIDQIVINLCINAREAMGNNTGRIVIETDVTVPDDMNVKAEGEQHAVITIRDDGKGMSEEVRQNIFEPFFTTKEFGEGTGLGLSTVYGIVQQNSGYITVDSSPGEGTAVGVYFPLRQGTELPQPKEELPDSMLGRGEQVLVVDDDQMIRSVTASMLERLNYHVITVDSGREALKVIAAGSDIRVLVTDVVMPEMDGRELFDEVRQIRPDIGCLFISGYSPKADLMGTSALFLQKPFSSADLAEKLRILTGHE